MGRKTVLLLFLCLFYAQLALLLPLRFTTRCRCLCRCSASALLLTIGVRALLFALSLGNDTCTHSPLCGALICCSRFLVVVVIIIVFVAFRFSYCHVCCCARFWQNIFCFSLYITFFFDLLFLVFLFFSSSFFCLFLLLLLFDFLLLAPDRRCDFLLNELLLYLRNIYNHKIHEFPFAAFVSILCCFFFVVAVAAVVIAGPVFVVAVLIIVGRFFLLSRLTLTFYLCIRSLYLRLLFEVSCCCCRKKREWEECENNI